MSMKLFDAEVVVEIGQGIRDICKVWTQIRHAIWSWPALAQR